MYMIGEVGAIWELLPGNTARRVPGSTVERTNMCLISSLKDMMT